jgi:hypothetical protein
MHAGPLRDSSSVAPSITECKQEAAHGAEGLRRRGRLQHTNRFLGRPSVGGQLTAVQFGTKTRERSPSGKVQLEQLNRDAEEQAHNPLRRATSIGLPSPCEPVQVRQLRAHLVKSAALPRRWGREWHPCLKQEQSARSPHSERRHLTPPSSGRPPASFACLRPPLMSNVRQPRSRQ